MRATERTSRRPQTAYNLRALGFSWAEIARLTDYAHGRSALASVQSWRAAHHLPNPSPPRRCPVEERP